MLIKIKKESLNLETKEHVEQLINVLQKTNSPRNLIHSVVISGANTFPGTYQIHAKKGFANQKNIYGRLWVEDKSEGATLFNIPVDFRPASNQYFVIPMITDPKSVVIMIDTDGNVVLHSYLNVSEYTFVLALDGLTWY